MNYSIFAADGAPHRGHVPALPHRLRFLRGQNPGALVHRKGGLRGPLAQLVAPDHCGGLLPLAQHRTGLCRIPPEQWLQCPRSRLRFKIVNPRSEERKWQPQRNRDSCRL